jgi:cytochrome P450
VLHSQHDTVFTKGIDATYEMLCREPYRLNQLEYTTNVIKEVLRFYPVGNTARASHPAEPFLEYKGERYSTKDKMVCPVQMSMHMNPDIFTNPLVFDPDRFARQDFERLAWRPWAASGYGRTQDCIAFDDQRFRLHLCGPQAEQDAAGRLDKLGSGVWRSCFPRICIRGAA